jgi:polyisoprenoid-binding protein YceI
LVAAAVSLLTAQDKQIDSRRSKITIHVGTAGFLSVAGHEHWVNAPISSGVLNASDSPRVEFTVDAARMHIKPDPKVEAKTQAEIQKDMQERTLESSVYPEIVFRSSHVEKQAEGRWRVEGTLALHGVTQPISVLVWRSGDAYAGHTTLRQTDFRIKPISAVGGAVKVKNDLEIDFSIVAAQ